MFKKLVIAAAAVLVGLVVVWKLELGTLLQTYWNDWAGWAAKQIPPEQRIKELRLEVAKIDNDIRDAITAQIKVAVEHDKLKKEVEALTKTQEKRAADLTVMVDALEKGTTSVSFGGENVSRKSFVARVEAHRAAFVAGKESLKTKEDTLKQMNEQLELADQKVYAIKAKKAEMEIRVEKLASRLAELRRKQVVGSIPVSDTRLGSAEMKAKNLEELLAEEEKRLELTEKYLGEGSTPAVKQEGPSPEEVLKKSKEALENKAPGDTN